MDSKSQIKTAAEKTTTSYVTLHFPILHIESTLKEQESKVIEEYNEFKKELFRGSAPDRMLHELQDIMQAYITLLYLQTKPTSLDDREADQRVADLIERENQKHRRKMEQYRAERGWSF